MRARVARGAIWVTAARMAVNALGFVSTIVLARLLVPADFGLVALATTMLAILSSITSMSLSSALVQHSDPTREHLDTSFTLNSLRSLGVALLFCASAFPMAAIYDEPRLPGLIFALSVSLLLEGCVNPRLGLLMRDLSFRKQFAVDVSTKLAGLIVSIAVAVIFRSYWALVAGTIAGQFCGSVLSYVLAPYRPRWSTSKWREMLSYSVWLTLGQVVNTLNWRLDQLLIGAMLGRSALGHYTVGDNLAAMPTREVTTPLTSTLFPAFARLKEDRERLAAAYNRAQLLLTAVALPLGVGTALVARPAIEIALGAKWEGAIIVVQVLGAVFAFQTLARLSQPLGMAVGATRLLFLRDLQQLFIRVPLVVGGIVVWGLPGLLGARAVNGLIGIVMNMGIVRRITGLSYAQQLVGNYRAFISIAAMTGAVLAVPDGYGDWFQLLARTAVGGMVYVGVHMGLWLAAGRPDGAEAELLRLISQVMERIRGRSAAQEESGQA